IQKPGNVSNTSARRPPDTIHMVKHELDARRRCSLTWVSGFAADREPLNVPLDPPIRIFEAADRGTGTAHHATSHVSKIAGEHLEQLRFAARVLSATDNDLLVGPSQILVKI